MNLPMKSYCFYLTVMGVTFFDTISAQSSEICEAVFNFSNPPARASGKTIIDPADAATFSAELDAMKSALEQNKFTTTRGLSKRQFESEPFGYDDIFSGKASSGISLLNSNSHIVEIGIGSGKAMFQGLQTVQNTVASTPQTTGIAITLPPEYQSNRSIAISNGVDLSQHKIILGYLEHLAIEKIGAADVVWDVASANRYTLFLPEILTKELQLLKPQGKLYTILEAHIYDEIGKPLTAESFARRIKGVRVLEFKRDTSVHSSKNAIILIRENSPIEVPNLKLDFLSGTIPPMRVYRIVP